MIIPALLVGSWVAVRSQAASPAPERPGLRAQGEMGDPPAPVAGLSPRELRDPALARYIGALAAESRR
ncbi:MAG TPA: hypothetical protein VIF57_05845 [Polyangia bacterium]